MPSIETARAWYPIADPVHGFEHILRVLANAEHLAHSEGADLEIVRAAVLLHDATPPDGPGDHDDPAQRLEHHLASAQFAGQVLAGEGWPAGRIAAVQHCIRSHRFRDDREAPESLEAKVLFDADKLDAIGATGVARAVAYAARAGQPFYAPASRSFVENGVREPGEPHSSYHEFIFKLRRLEERLFTPAAKAIARQRHQYMEDFYRRLAAEISGEK